VELPDKAILQWHAPIHTCVDLKMVLTKHYAEFSLLLDLMLGDVVDAEVKDESEEPVDLIPTLIPLPPDEVCICLFYYLSQGGYVCHCLLMG